MERWTVHDKLNEFYLKGVCCKWPQVYGRV